jgi:hypothetical protein
VEMIGVIKTFKFQYGSDIGNPGKEASTNLRTMEKGEIMKSSIQ